LRYVLANQSSIGSRSIIARLSYRALDFEHIVAARDHAWLSTPGAIAEQYRNLPAALQICA